MRLGLVLKAFLPFCNFLLTFFSFSLSRMRVRAVTSSPSSLATMLLIWLSCPSLLLWSSSTFDMVASAVSSSSCRRERSPSRRVRSS
jgi:hypothetical protein